MHDELGTDQKEISPNVVLNWPRYPYPGLRPFRLGDSDESLIFRGRDAHIDDIIELLGKSQFVSVVGPSGCGKSSLIKVGIIPVLKASLLTSAGYNWETIDMRPGDDPVNSLATSLAELNRVGDAPPSIEKAEIVDLLTSKRSGLWLVMERLVDRFQSFEGAAKPKRVLLLLDQFEEIFSGIPEAHSVDRFLDLIKQFFHHPHPQLYVVLTMRSDFISQCANIPGLSEILNQTQYITPVLRGPSLIEAIEEPAKIYWGEVEPQLTQAILDDMGNGMKYDADHLPLMQHALLWMWNQSWRSAGQVEPPHPDRVPSPGSLRVRLTLAQYRKHGGLYGILNQHADSIFAEVADGTGGQQRGAIMETIFRRLTERDASARYKRAPATESEISRIAQCNRDQIDAVISPFMTDDASFVERRPGLQGTEQWLDISHESLIRQWALLRTWADDEADKVGAFRKLVEDAQGWVAEGRAASLLRSGRQLSRFEEWLEHNKPSEAWAKRYIVADRQAGSLADCLPLVNEYGRASLARRRVKRFNFAAAFAMAVIGALYLSLQFIWSAQREYEARAEAVQADVAIKLGEHDPEGAVLVALGFLHGPGQGGDSAKLDHLITQALRDFHERDEVQTRGLLFSVAYSPDGRWITATEGGLPVFWDAAQPQSGSETKIVDNASYWRVVWNPRGAQLLLTAQDQTTVLLPVGPDGPNTNALIRLGERDAGPDTRLGSGAAYSGDGRKVITGGMGYPLRVFDALGDEHSLEARQGDKDKGPEAFILAANSDGSRIAVPNAKSTVDIYAVTGSLIRQIRSLDPPQNSARTPRALDSQGHCSTAGTQSQVHALAFHPVDPRLLLYAAKCRVIAVDAATGDRLFRLGGGNTSEIYKVAFSNDGALIATGAQDGTVAVYRTPVIGDTSSADSPIVPLAYMGKHDSVVYDLGFSKDGDFIASGDRNGMLRIWSVVPFVQLKGGENEGQLQAKASDALPKNVRPLSGLDRCIAVGNGAPGCAGESFSAPQSDVESDD